MKKRLNTTTLSGTGAVICYLVFSFLAFLPYPLPYSPAANWLSDLGSKNFNPRGAILYNTGVILSASLLILFFLGLSRWRMENVKAQKLLLFLAQACGTAGSFCMIMSALFPIHFFAIHSFWSSALYILLSTGFVFSASALRYHPHFPRWLVVMGIATSPVVILCSLFQQVCLLEWVTLLLFLGYVSLVALQTRRLGPGNAGELLVNTGPSL